jgi:hypothetical protein
MDLDATAELVPVSQWVYDLYRVEYWQGDPDQAGRVIKTVHLASSCQQHLNTDADELAPSGCDYITWDVVKHNVGHPRVVGNIHGLPLSESALSFGTRLARQL